MKHQKTISTEDTAFVAITAAPPFLFRSAEMTDRELIAACLSPIGPRRLHVNVARRLIKVTSETHECVFPDLLAFELESKANENDVIRFEVFL